MVIITEAHNFPACKNNKYSTLTSKHTGLGIIMNEEQKGGPTQMWWVRTDVQCLQHYTPKTSKGLTVPTCQTLNNSLIFRTLLDFTVTKFIDWFFHYKTLLKEDFSIFCNQLYKSNQLNHDRHVY